MVAYKHAKLGDCETESKVIEHPRSASLTLVSAEEKLYGIYKPTGNPQAEGRLGMLKGKMKLNAASSLFKVGLRIIPHMICEIEYSIKVFVGICLTNPRGGG